MLGNLFNALLKVLVLVSQRWVGASTSLAIWTFLRLKAGAFRLRGCT